jgi:hypothetical protein
MVAHRLPRAPSAKRRVGEIGSVKTGYATAYSPRIAVQQTMMGRDEEKVKRET